MFTEAIFLEAILLWQFVAIPDKLCENPVAK
jgi:hypothetical protein